MLHVQCEGEHPELLIAREPFHKCPLFFDKKLTRFYEPHDVAWQKVVELLAHAGARPQVDKVFPFDQLPQAFERLARGPMGKVLLAVRSAG